ncbi:MAG: MFS transporter [Cyanobacteria bacterium REEB67]|nr:MFS transporter [Cyanobacteria bacterium REEB67]
MTSFKPTVVNPGETSGFFLKKALAPSLTAQQSAIARCGYSVTFLAGLNSGWFGAILPSMAQFQHLPLAQIGLLVSASSAGALTSLIVSSPIIGKLGDVKATLLAVTLASAGFLGLAFFSGLYPLIACAYCVGLGFGLNGITNHILFPRYYPHRVASSLSKLNVFFGVGALLGPMVALALLSAHAPYLFIFLGAAIYTLAIALYLWRANAATGSRAAEIAGEMAGENGGNKPAAALEVKSGVVDKGADTEGTLAILKHPLLIALTAINFLYVGLESSLGTWIYTFLQRADSLSGQQAAAGTTLLYAGLTLGRLISTRACLRFNPKYITMTAMLLLTTAIFSLANWHGGAFGAMALVLLSGLGLGPIFPTVIAQNAIRFPTATGLTTTLVIASGYVGGILLPWAAGNLIAGSGTNPASLALVAGNSMFAAAGVATLMPIILGFTLFPRGFALRGSRLDAGAPLKDSKD